MTMINHRDIVMPEFLKWIEKINLKNKRVLELGPGFEFDFKKVFEEKGAKYTGIDKEFLSEKVYRGDITEINFPDKYFDYCFVCHCLEHSQSPLQTYLHIKRKCKKGFFFVQPYHCHENIINNHPDRFFVLTELQIMKICLAVGLKIQAMLIIKPSDKPEDWQLITYGVV